MPHKIRGHTCPGVERHWADASTSPGINSLGYLTSQEGTNAVRVDFCPWCGASLKPVPRVYLLACSGCGVVRALGPNELDGPCLRVVGLRDLRTYPAGELIRCAGKMRPLSDRAE